MLAHVADVLAEIDSDPGSFAEARELFEIHPRLRMSAGHQPHYFELPFFKPEADSV